MHSIMRCFISVNDKFFPARATLSAVCGSSDAALKNGSMLDRLGCFGVAVRSFDKLFVDGQWLDSTGSGRCRRESAEAA
jgi:hypothetical protein